MMQELKQISKLCSRTEHKRSGFGGTGFSEDCIVKMRMAFEGQGMMTIQASMTMACEISGLKWSDT